MTTSLTDEQFGELHDSLIPPQEGHHLFWEELDGAARRHARAVYDAGFARAGALSEGPAPTPGTPEEWARVMGHLYDWVQERKAAGDSVINVRLGFVPGKVEMGLWTRHANGGGVPVMGDGPALLEAAADATARYAVALAELAAPLPETQR